MDAAVIEAMGRWPDVPAVFGWLELDRRGRWLIKGERIGNPSVTAFIGRNYASEAQGRWFFQNGPQRVFARLHYTPFVYHVLPAAGNEPGLETHIGTRVTRLHEALVDEAGSLVLRTEAGVGVVSDRDLPMLAPLLRDERGNALDEDALGALQAGHHVDGAVLHWHHEDIPVEPVHSSHVPRLFDFNPDPRPAPGDPDC
jgi:hypothetical protein